VTTKGVGWASEKASDLVAPPLNLVLYMHLRVFAYTSNTLISSFEYMELILDSGTLKNFRLFVVIFCFFLFHLSVVHWGFLFSSMVPLASCLGSQFFV
jgi:hypothetical protein